MFFSRFDEKEGFSNIYWLSNEVIEKLRPKI
ncbi:hypothetical protein C1E23_09785 [Pseudoalteromonas phenolica]|uniref:Uncharacterized protein n=1 Tax=Pseudoalteromonas phenolica TaxID=161398 RepID=A0A4Q7INR4_9GAMM|nr:hypothetical protein C1E23_09785 [Pseudoalteromonas phenolica]